VLLKKVGLNFLQTLVFYSIILLAFALSFYTLINESKGNTSIGSKMKESEKFSMFSVFFYVFLMLTGDYDIISGRVTDFVIGRLCLLVFVFSMSIVMMNLLIGLTISDTADIKRETKSNQWGEWVKLLIKYEILAKCWW
jgi:transient receptor potential cation channel subfamily A member 1